MLLTGLTVEAQAGTLTWNGGSMEWNTTDDNWLLDEIATKYTNDADVVFGNTGDGRVTLVGSFAPKSVLVENTPGHTYFFNGNGNLTGAMQLTKDGEGLLFIDTANDYKGGTVIKGGTLQMVDENALGSEDVTLMGGTLNLGEQTLSNNVNVNGSGHIANGTVSGNLSLADNASFTWEEGSFLELTGSITLGNNTTLDLGKHTLSQNVILNGAETSIGNGSINHDLTVAGQKLTLAGYVDGTGNIILGDGARLVLNDYTLSNKVVLKGSAVISGGTLDSDLTVGANKRLSLDNNLTGKGNIILADHSELFLFHSTLSNNVILNGNDAVIDASVGTLSGDLILADNASFTWANCESLQFTGSVTLGNEASLNLGGNTLSNNVNVTGSRAYIGGGSFSGELTVGTNKELSLCGELSGNGTIILGESAKLDLGKHTLSQNVILNGAETSIGNGSINNDLTVNENRTLCLRGYVDGTGNIILGDGARLVLNDYTLSNKVVLKGSAVIGGGTLDSDLTVGEFQYLSIDDNLKGTGNIILGSGAMLHLAGNNTLSKSVSLNGGARILAHGTISGDLILADNTSFLWSSVFLDDDVQLTGNIALGERTDLDLGGHAISNNIILNGYDTYIGNGSINHDLAVERGALYLAGNIDGTGNIILGSGAKLRLAGYTLSNSVTLKGNAVVGGGTLDSNLTVGKSQILTIEYDLKGKGNIILADDSALFLFNSTLSSSVILNENAHIGGVGTISGDFILADNASFSWEKGSPLDSVQLTGNITLGERTLLDLGSKTLSASVKLGKNSTITAYSGSSNTTIKTRESADSALLEKVSVSDGLIAGTDRQASLADGLDINRMGYNLTLENLVLTANNEIHVGEHTITLKDVTIKMSDDICERIESTFYFNLQPLINCDLVMENVLLDASALTLPEGFDPANKSVVFDFGDDVTIKQATGLDMRLGNYWSTSLNLDEQGQVIFTKLVDTPEPTTGTLGLLALAALAARRRRK